MGTSTDAVSGDVAPADLLPLDSSVEPSVHLVESKSISILAGPPVSPVPISDSCEFYLGFVHSLASVDVFYAFSKNDL